MYEFRFPDIGEGIAEGVILKWFVDVGHEVKEGDSLFLVETDKVNAEIPAPTGGTVLATFGAVGDTIHVGDVVVSIGDGTTPAKLVAAEETADEEAIKEDNAAVVGALKRPPLCLKQVLKALLSSRCKRGARFWLRPWHVNWLRILVWISVASQAQGPPGG